MPTISRDVVALPVEPGRWLLYNVFAKTSLGVDSCTLAFLSDGVAEDDRAYRVWNTSSFTNIDCILDDPSLCIPCVEDWIERSMSGSAVLETCRRQFIIVDDHPAYLAALGRMTSVLDTSHLGNFHDRLGRELWLKRRTNPSAWWSKQKFEDGQAAVRKTLYRAVQEYNLKRVFRDRLRPGMTVVDLGCGAGYFSRLMAETGASVIGLDPNPEYIRSANEHATKGCRFSVALIGQPNALDEIEGESVDIVFMSDALLFYFRSVTPGIVSDLSVLRSDIHRVLAQGGSFISCEPHSLFFLRPWFGEHDRPFTVVAGYGQNDQFGIVPGMVELVKGFVGRGFSVVDMEEFGVDPHHREKDPRAFGFANAYPLWQLIEFRKD